MRFSIALDAVLGSRQPMRRVCWCAGEYIIYLSEVAMSYYSLISVLASDSATVEVTPITVGPVLVKIIGRRAFVYTPSQEDIFATDWEISD